MTQWGRLFSSGWMLVAILALTLGVYSPTLTHWFSRDDFWFLRADQSHPLGSYILRSFDFRSTAPSTEVDRYRPLYPLVWRLQYAAFGMHAAYYHAVLVGLHLICVTLVWFIARRVFTATWAAVITTLIFAIHPTYADAVEWLSAGNRIFEAVPYLASLLFFMKFIDSSEHRRYGSYAICWVAFLIAVLLHSSAIILALVFPAYAVLLGGQARDALRPQWWIHFAPFALVAVLETGIQLWVRHHLGVQGVESFRFGFFQYANYGEALSLVLQPVKGTDLTGTLRSVAEYSQLLASLVMLALTIGILSRRPLSNLGVFAVLWFYLALLPDSTFTFGISGRHLYVPGMPATIILVVALIWLRDAAPPRLSNLGVRAAPYALLITLLPVLALTYARTLNLRHEADRDERFATALRAQGPHVPVGGTLYVVGAPDNLKVFDDSRLGSLVQLYDGDIHVQSLSRDLLPQVQSTLAQNEAVFEYQP